MYAWSLSLALAAFWLALSGHYTALLVSLGALSCALCVWLCRRMNILDSDAQPVQLLPGLLGYFAWLCKETLLSNWRVCRLILSGRKIEAATAEIRLDLEKPIDQALYANSITLTPGTLSMSLQDKHLVVHALEASDLKDLQNGQMQKRIADLSA